jgi:hypothetical protein
MGMSNVMVISRFTVAALLFGWVGAEIAEGQVRANCKLAIVKDRGGVELVSVQKDRSRIYFKRTPQENGRKFNNYGTTNPSGQIIGSPAAWACSQGSSSYTRLSLPTETDANFLLSCFEVNPSNWSVLSSDSQKALDYYFPIPDPGFVAMYWTSTVNPRSYTATLLNLRMGQVAGAPYVQEYPVLCRADPK